jgi:hypothetical protein
LPEDNTKVVKNQEGDHPLTFLSRSFRAAFFIRRFQVRSVAAFAPAKNPIIFVSSSFNMEIISEPIGLDDLWNRKQSDFTDLIKIVVDIDRSLLAADAEMHADLEQTLLEQGSQQQHLWGANIYPERKGDEFIEYTSFINIRPSDGNRSMEVMNPLIREKIKKIVEKLLV